MEGLDEKKARHAELLAKHGPHDGAVIELGQEIEALEAGEGKPEPEPAANDRADELGA